ncbi:hypothetical protein PV327_007643 [Microctonus hyperodae]|uniref:Ferritin n=1 Tax=Microctonus hyperodae TaxID=165561 RepID=A0AA39FZM3_MICHY|nr:hypothetical protein PV327_007643 [Microctonus hyperodae]
MKVFCALLFALSCIHISAGDGLKCTLKPTDINVPWRDMVDPCIKLLEAQVKLELYAAMKYMSMGAHFGQDKVNLPGFSKTFYDNANEERDHAKKVLQYLLMRGELTRGVTHLIQPLKEVSEPPTSTLQALKDALALEAQVTRALREIIQVCEEPKDSNFNDYHLADYLTTDFLDEQYKGQRQLAERIATLGKMVHTQGALADFIMDQKLMKGEI